jgi:hypothetical protein
MPKHLNLSVLSKDLFSYFYVVILYYIVYEN